jgi:UDP-N-acetylglucosamine 1-carboxyvinyltransferase
VIPDRIETGTLVIAAALTQGTLKITNVIPEHLSLFFSKMQQIGVNMQVKSGEITVKPATNFKPIYIDTRPYPGFSTDLQAPTAVLLTQAKGTSQIFETLFENRFNYVQELQKMGAKIKILDRHNIAISGPTLLHPAHLYCSDLRAGACLLLAALSAKGESMIDNVELIERGYETLDQRLNQIGAQIKRLP